MKYLSANLRALEHNNSGITARITQRFRPHGKLRVIASASGIPSAMYGTVHIHSTRDPMREAERIVQQFLSARTTHCLFYGFGLGYYVECFQKLKTHYQQGVVVIPDGNDFLQALALRDMRAVLSDPAFCWLIESDAAALESALQELPYGTVEEISIKPLLEAYHSQLEPLRTRFRRFQRGREVNIRTHARFGALWVRNLKRNLVHLTHMYDLTVVKGLFRGVPAMVIGAGPSLDSILDYLPALRKHLLLIAVDTALQPLARRGIRPDIIVIVDPQYWNSRYIDYIDSRRAMVVVEPSAYPRNLRGASRSMFYFASLVPFARLLHNAMGVPLSVSGGGSVATTGWEIAAWMGASTIYLAGIDLGYPHHRVHCRGCTFEEQMHLSATRCAPSEYAHLKYLYNAPLIAFKTVEGAPLLSDQRLQLYIMWLEERLRQRGAPPTFTVSRLGAGVQGVVYRELSTLVGAIGSVGVRKQIEHRWSARETVLKNGFPTLIARQQRESRRALRAYRDAIDALHTPLREAQELCQKIISHPSSRAALERRLHDITGTILNNPYRHILSATIMGDIDSRAGESYQGTLDLYKSMADNIAEHQKIATEALESLGAPS